MSNMINLGINEDIVKPILEKQIEAAVIANIGDPTELIQKVVSRALNQKVDRNGNVSGFSSDNKYTYLEVLTNESIQSAANEALHEWTDKNKKIIKELVIKELNKPERQDSIVVAFANAVEESLELDWNFNCDVHFTEKERRYEEW